MENHMTEESGRRILSIRPSKSASRAGVIMLIFMFMFGIGFSFLIGNVLYENDAPAGLAFVFFIFMIGWFTIVVYLLIYNLQNLRRAKGVPLIEIDVSKDK